MNLQNKKKIAVLAIACCALILTATIFPAQAAERSHVLTIALFASGMGLKFGSAFVKNSSQDSYDQYLNSALQADITKHRDDYTSKDGASVLMSRVGIGLVGLAALITVFNQFERIAQPSSSESAALRLTPSYDFRTHETTLLFQHRF